MNRIQRTFSRLRAEQRTGLIPFVMAGDPDLPTTEQVVEALASAGADLIELGVPFSDPVADGPINQRASQRALRHGVALVDVLNLVGRMRSRVSLPFVVLSYYNPILQYGLARFCADAAASGVDGVVIPDLPPDEARELIDAARSVDLDTIFLLAPTSTDARIHLVAERSTGFIYCVSLTGVTGIRDHLSEDVRELVRKIKKVTQLPVCVGFGVSTPDQARQVAEVADGVIVGSALVSLLEAPGDRIARLQEFVGGLRKSVDAVRVGEGGPP